MSHSVGKEAVSADRFRGPELDDAPHPPEGGRIVERIAVHKREVRGAADLDPPGVGVAEHGTALPGRGAERLPRLKPRLDQRLHLPGEVTGANRTAAEVAPGRDRYARLVGEPD